MSEIAMSSRNNNSIENRYLIFSIGDTDYALGIANIIEIIEIPAITFVPNMPAYVKGIINLRGSTIPVVDSRIKFGYEEIEYNSRTCIIVIEKDDVAMGLIVDFVKEVMDILPGETTVPASAESLNYFVKSVGKGRGFVQLIIDYEKLFEGA